jgi:cytochrome P450
LNLPTPDAPCDPFFDCARNFWVLSRYTDVLAALHESGLWPVSALKKKNVKIPDEAALHALRTRVLEAFSRANLDRWRAEIEVTAQNLPSRGAVDLMEEFIEPFCETAAEIITGANRSDRESLVAAARIVSRAAAEPFDETLRREATRGDAELAHYFANSTIPMAGPTFVAISRTVACVLANGWLAMLTQKAEAGPVSRTVEEILRYACVPDLVFRQASRQVTLCGLELKEGDKLILRIGSANRDPAQFSDPNRFDSSRRGPSHLSLGFGFHACTGGALIRMLARSATAAFLERFSGAEVDSVEWQGGSGFRYPSRLCVLA